MPLYLSTPVRASNPDDLKIRARLMKSIDYLHKGLEIWQLTREYDDINCVDQQISNLISILGKNYQEKYLITMQARRKKLGAEPHHPQSYYNIRTKDGKDNLVQNAEVAKRLGARWLVFHPFVAFRYPYGYRKKYEQRQFRELIVKEVVDITQKTSRECKIPILIEHPTVPIWGEIDPKLIGGMFEVGFGFYEELKLIPPEMLVFDTCHYQSSLVASERIKKRELFIPATMNLLEQPTLTEALKSLRSKEVHLNDYSGLWVSNQQTFEEGLIPGDGIIGREGFREILQIIEKYSTQKDVVAVIETRDRYFQNPQESKEGLNRVVEWLIN